MVIYPVRCSFVAVFNPAKKKDSDDRQYGVCGMVPKADKDLVATVLKAQTQAIKDGIEKGYFTLAQAKAASFRKIIHDGDAAYEAEERGPEFKGMLYFSCNRGEAKGAPQVVKRDPTTKQIVDVVNQDEFYSGAWAALDVNFYPHKYKGVAVGLNNVMVYKDSKLDSSRLDGRSIASDAFANIEGGIDETAIDSSDDTAGGDDFF